MRGVLTQVQDEENTERDELDHDAVLDALVKISACIENQTAICNGISQGFGAFAGNLQDDRANARKKASRQDQSRGIIVEC